MDIFSHAIAGAATGALYGHPLIGAVAAVLPDLAIAGPRRAHPPAIYKFSHSFLAIAVLALAVSWFPHDVMSTIVFAYMSHILLDLFTHGEEWSPRWFWPYDIVSIRGVTEWEFFNRTWWAGAAVTLVYSLICFMVAYA